MISWKSTMAGMAVVICSATTPALARYYKIDDVKAQLCTKEFTDNKDWRFSQAYPYVIVEAIKGGKVSADCQKEIERLGKYCLTEKYEMGRYEGIVGKKNPKNISKEDFCTQSAWWAISNDLNNVAQAAEAEEAKKKKAAEEKAAKLAETAKVELPKPARKDATVEKQVAAAYKKDYPDNQVLKVIVVGDWITDRNDFGAVTGRHIQVVVVNEQKDQVMIERWGTNGRYCELHSEAWEQEYRGGKFVGPLSAAGAGSMSKEGILCDKASGK
jgi:hypothetical protein